MSWPASNFGPAGQQQGGTFLNAFVFVDNDLFQGKAMSHAQSVAVGAHTQRTVEAE